MLYACFLNKIYILTEIQDTHKILRLNPVKKLFKKSLTSEKVLKNPVPNSVKAFDVRIECNPKIYGYTKRIIL